MKLEKYIGIYENEIVSSAKTISELKEKLQHVQVINIYPVFKIFEITTRQIDRFYCPKETNKEVKVPSNDKS